MGSMYKSKTANWAIIGVSIVALVVFALFIRRQTAVSDSEFLRSMIPHHGGAILMCQQNEIEDAEIRNLCGEIVSSQQFEIDWMKTKLGEMKK